jgi:hypothetical protein
MVPCPADFALTDRMRAWAATNVPIAIRSQLARYTTMFTNHYVGGIGAEALAADWELMWQTWMLRQLDFVPRGPTALTAPAAGPPRRIVNGGSADVSA